MAIGDKKEGPSTFGVDPNLAHFVLPPRHRLFAVFDDVTAARQAVAQLAAEGLDGADVWVFFGAEGVDRIHPRIRRHGLRTALVRAFQRVMTSDDEYSQGLAEDLQRGATILAVKVDGDRAQDISERLQRSGARDLAYAGHWNYLPVPRSA
jgi:hypothetical protein